MAAQVQALLKTLPSDPHARKELYEAAKNLVAATESESDMRFDLLHSAVITPNIAQIALNLGMIDDLVSDPSRVWSAADLAAMYNADPVIIARLARALTAYHLVDQPSKDTFQANRRTQYLATPAGRANIAFCNKAVKQATGALPEVLAASKYQSVKTVDGLVAASVGHNTKEPIFEHLFSSPQKAQAMLAYMGTFTVGMPQVFDGGIDLSDFKISPADIDAGRIVMVDVGGGAGHQAIELRIKQPALKGKIVVTDLQHQIGLVDVTRLKELDIGPIVHDFMTPQPVKHAKVYYLRNILHDWDDAACLVILSQIRDAMADDSVIAIDELVIDTSSLTQLGTGLDLTMMSLGLMQRTEEQWHDLLTKAQLRIKAVHTYDSDGSFCLIVAVKA